MVLEYIILRKSILILHLRGDGDGSGESTIIIKIKYAFKSLGHGGESNRIFHNNDYGQQ